MKVFVYKNLTESKRRNQAIYSIRHKGIVIAHAHRVELDNVTFKVSEKGRQRVLRTKQKNVHAGVEGLLRCYHGGVCKIKEYSHKRRVIKLMSFSTYAVKYNPYFNSSFVLKNDENVKVTTARHCIMDGYGVVVNSYQNPGKAKGDISYLYRFSTPKHLYIRMQLDNKGSSIVWGRDGRELKYPDFSPHYDLELTDPTKFQYMRDLAHR